MDVVVTIAEYKNRMKSMGYSRATRDAYGRYLDLFRDWLLAAGIDDLRKVTRRVVLDYRAKVMAEPIAMESRALWLRPVKRLFERLADEQRLLVNPAEGIVETCRKGRKIACVLTRDETKRIMRQPNLSLPTGIRDRAVMEVLYSTAVRINELLSLEVWHADLRDGVLHVRKAKGGGQRVVPLGKNAAKFLKEYLEKVRPVWAKKNPKERRMFLTHSGKPLTRGTVQSFIRKYRIEAGIDRPVSPHTFRRTCATHMLGEGADIRHIQKLLGHKRLDTTQFYTKTRPADVKKTHEKTHPGKDFDDDEDQ